MSSFIKIAGKRGDLPVLEDDLQKATGLSDRVLLFNVLSEETRIPGDKNKFYGYRGGKDTCASLEFVSRSLRAAGANDKEICDVLKIITLPLPMKIYDSRYPEHFIKLCASSIDGAMRRLQATQRGFKKEDIAVLVKIGEICGPDSPAVFNDISSGGLGFLMKAKVFANSFIVCGHDFNADMNDFFERKGINDPQKRGIIASRIKCDMLKKLKNFKDTGDAVRSFDFAVFKLEYFLKSGVYPLSWFGYIDEKGTPAEVAVETKMNRLVRNSVDEVNRTLKENGYNIRITYLEVMATFLGEHDLDSYYDFFKKTHKTALSLGVDTFGDLLESKDSFIRPFTGGFAGLTIINDINELKQIRGVEDFSNEQAIKAYAVMCAYKKHCAQEYIQKTKGVDISTLPVEGQFFWTYIFFNSAHPRQIVDRNPVDIYAHPEKIRGKINPELGKGEELDMPYYRWQQCNTNPYYNAFIRYSTFQALQRAGY